MTKSQYAAWLVGHRARITAALDSYIDALKARKSANLIAKRFDVLCDILDETDQLGARPKAKLAPLRRPNAPVIKSQDRPIRLELRTDGKWRPLN